MDEGFYIYAAQNILKGELLYVDFVFHQFPFSVYIFSLLSGFGFDSYILLRYFSFALTFALLLLIHRHVYRFTTEKSAANTAMLIIIFNGLFLVWNSVVKMYPLVNIFFFSAFYCSTIIKFNNSTKDLILCFATGLLAGLTLNTRFSYLLPCFVLTAFVIYKLLHSGDLFNKRFLYMTALFSGFILPSLIAIYFLIFYLDEFIFGVFKVNFYAEQLKWAAQDSNYLIWLKFYLQPQNLLLIVFILFCLKFKIRNKIYIYSIIFSLILANFFGYYLNEYFTMVVPFIAYVIGMCYNDLKDGLKYKNFLLFKPLLVLYIVCIFVGIPYFRNLTMGQKIEPSIPVFKEMVNFENSLPGSTILSSWLNYSVFSNKKNPLKNDYIYAHILGKADSEEIKRYSLPDTTVLRRQIENKEFDVIVLHYDIPYLLYGYRNLIRSKYNLIKTYNNKEFYTRF